MATLTPAVRVAWVCIPHTHRDYFDYLAPDIPLEVGARVWVPFRNKTRLGIVVGEGGASTHASKLKSLLEVIDETPLLPAALLAVCRWVSQYYQAPLSEVLPLALPKKYRQGEPHQPQHVWVAKLTLEAEKAHAMISTRAHRQHALIDYLNQHPVPLTKKQLVGAGFKSAQLQPLMDCGVLVFEILSGETKVKASLKEAPLPLNTEQANALHTITAHLHAYRCFLLQGVTGSGKTEVYLQAIAQVLAAGRQVLVLVPEIGLTPQLLARFENRFNTPVEVVHSRLNDTQRQRVWQSALEGNVRLIIGTRAAVFTPLPALGLIVVDEEHDASLKQMEGVRYSARDTALMRAHRANVPIILGSATPALESVYNSQQDKYTLLRLSQKARSTLPLQYQVVDIRSQPLQHGLANVTLARIREHLQQGNQVLVFINRRGFAPVLLCHQCGWMADCRSCDSHLTWHRATQKITCHHCGFSQPLPACCPSCQSSELVPVGIGTQRIHAFLQEQFPSTQVVRVDRDEVRKKRALEDSLDRILSGDAQLIVGTQMLAKGHHFPQLTLVVILDTDNGFHSPDFRALERLGQLLTQVAGRAGRDARAGHVVIQTHLPQHPLLIKLMEQGYQAFAQDLLHMRHQAQLPPFTFLAMIRAQGKVVANLLKFLHEVKAMLQAEGVLLLGPAPAPMARKAAHYRFQLLVKSASRRVLNQQLTALRMALARGMSTHQGVVWHIDVDPVELS